MHGKHELRFNFSFSKVLREVAQRMILRKIAPHWKGYYIMFTEDFYRSGTAVVKQKRITEQYPFLLSDNTFPLSASPIQAELFFKTIEDIYYEHHR